MKKFIIILIILFGCDNSKKSKTNLEKGQDLFAAGSYSEALEKFEAFYAKSPKKKTVETLVGINWSKLKLVKESSLYLNQARVGFDEAIDLDPSNNDAKYGYCLLSYSIKSDLTNVETLLNEVINSNNYTFSLDESIDKKYPLLLYSMVNFYQKDYSSALSSYASLKTLLGETSTLNQNDSDFIFKLSDAIEVMVSRLNNFNDI